MTIPSTEHLTKAVRWIVLLGCLVACFFNSSGNISQYLSNDIAMISKVEPHEEGEVALPAVTFCVKKGYKTVWQPLGEFGNRQDDFTYGLEQYKVQFIEHQTHEWVSLAVPI